MDNGIGFRPDIFSNSYSYNSGSANTALSARASHISHNQTSFYWTQWNSGQMCPRSAVEGGYDVDGAPIFIGRVHHAGDLIPAKVIPAKSVAYYPYGGEEISTHNCEVLCQQTFQWVGSSHGNVPHGAVPAGHTSDGETLYIARAFHEGSHCIGKLHPSHGTCYVPFGGREHSHSTDYEVLVQTDFYHC